MRIREKECVRENMERRKEKCKMCEEKEKKKVEEMYGKERDGTVRKRKQWHWQSIEER